MKKNYSLMFLLLCWLTCATNVHAQLPFSSPNEKAIKDVENRAVYGAIMNNPRLEGYGIGSFNTGSQENMTLLHKWGNARFIFAGAAAHGEYYGYFYDYESLGGALPASLSKINLRTGEIKDVKDWSNETVKFQDMTFDYSTNTMYAVGFLLGDPSLYTVDLETGNITKGAGTKTLSGPITLGTLAATYDGRLYGIGINGILYQIDKETGYLTSVLETGKILQSMQSMEFDHTDESLYWISDATDKNNNAENNFYKIDVEKKTIKSLGQAGGIGTRVVGLYIPYVKAGFDAPGLVTDLKVTPGSKGAEEAVITWKNPEKTHGGDPLKGSIATILERDGKTISSSLGKIGAEMSWTDKDVKQGEHIYTVKVSNSFGEGVRNDIDTYIGNDYPNYTSDLTIMPGNECKSVKLTWTIPEKGAHNGYYDKSNVTFKIVRYPDGTVLEENFKGSSYEDKSMKRLGAYSYGITAKNEAGGNKEYTTRYVVIAGKTIDIPYNCGFEDETIAKNQWTVVDSNKDAITWYINSGFGHAVFGDASVAVEYLPIETEIDADEWLISPPLNFEVGKDYYISFDTRSYGIDEFNITFGNLNSPESQTQIIKSALFTEDASETSTFQNHQFQLPKSQTGGVYCVGINLVTEYGESVLFQLNNVSIAEGTTGINSVSTGENAIIRLNGKNLAIDGNFMTADIYNTNGVHIATLSKNNAETTTVNWQPGIYLVKIAGTDTAYTQKVIIK